MSVSWNDPEWDKAATDGDEMYWWVYTDKRRKNIKYVKRYTPALAKLVAKRTGWKIEPIFNSKGEMIK